MSCWYDPIFGPNPCFGAPTAYGTLGYGWPAIAQVKTDPVPDQPVEESEPLKRNTFVHYGGGCGLPSPVPVPPLTDTTMRMMSCHSTLAFLFANIVKPITAGPFTVEVNPVIVESMKVRGEELDKRKRMIEDAFRPTIVKAAVRSACRSLQYGRWTQEVIFDLRDGFIVPRAFKSFLPWEVLLMQDEYRNFAGVRYAGGGENNERDARYLYHHVNDPELDPIFGYSRHANVLPEWWGKLQRALQIASLGDKATKIVPVVKGPSGQQLKADGTKTSGLDVAKGIAAALARREPVYMQQFILDDDDLDPNHPELAKFTAFDIDTLDLGDQGPAIEALLKVVTYDDVSMSRGWHQPERASMEGSNGTKAEAGVHKAGSIEDSESVQSDIFDSLNSQPVDQTLVANFGPGAKGSVFLKPGQLQDPDKQFKQEFVKTLAANTITAQEVFANANVRANMMQTEIIVRPEDEAQKILQESQAKQAAADKAKADALKAATQQQPDNGGVPVRIAASGNGNGHSGWSELTRLARAFDDLGRDE